MRASATSKHESGKQRAEGKDPAVESIEALRAQGVVALTKAQTATALQVSYRTITAMLRPGEIRFFRIGGKHVRIKIVEFMGPEILIEIQLRPQWKQDLEATRERLACKHQRAH
jgi:excisionase family DNA binding protein